MPDADLSIRHPAIDTAWFKDRLRLAAGIENAGRFHQWATEQLELGGRKRLGYLGHTVFSLVAFEGHRTVGELSRSFDISLWACCKNAESPTRDRVKSLSR